MEALYFGAIVVIIIFIFLHIGAKVNKRYEEHISYLMEIKLNLYTLQNISCKELFGSALKTPFQQKMRQIINITQCNRFEKQPQILEAVDNVISQLQHDMEFN